MDLIRIGRCRSCADKWFDYIYAGLPAPLVKAFCAGECPSCLNICSCKVSTSTQSGAH